MHLHPLAYAGFHFRRGGFLLVERSQSAWGASLPLLLKT